MTSPEGFSNEQSVLLHQVLEALKDLKQEHEVLSATVNAINGRIVNMNTAGLKDVQDILPYGDGTMGSQLIPDRTRPSARSNKELNHSPAIPASPSLSLMDGNSNHPAQSTTNTCGASRSSSTSRIVLTTYPGQSGIDPLPMSWGHKDSMRRGPVVVSRSHGTIRRRNGMFCWLTGRAKSSITKHCLNSYRCARRFLLHLPRPCCCEQQSRRRSQARLHQHRTSC